MRRVIAFFALMLIADAACALDTIEVERGMTGELSFTYDGPPLVTTQQDLAAPLLLRLEHAGEHRYTAWFIGSVEGEYDLRSLIRTRAGQAPPDLPALPVTVISNLPDTFATDLYDAADLRVGIKGGYARLMLALGVIWLAIPAAVLLRRIMRPKVVEPVEEVVPEPTLVERLRPLIRAAADRELSVPEQGRLELLLMHHWRERVAPSAADIAESIAVIRHHPDAGEVLEAVERWLHHADRGTHDPDRLIAILDRVARTSEREPTAAGGGALA